MKLSFLLLGCLIAALFYGTAAQAQTVEYRFVHRIDGLTAAPTVATPTGLTASQPASGTP